LRNRYSVVCVMSIDGLMPPNLVNVMAMYVISVVMLFLRSTRTIWHYWDMPIYLSAVPDLPTSPEVSQPRCSFGYA
jgi:hypothetical protein